MDIMRQSVYLVVNPITVYWPWHKALIRWLVSDAGLWLGPPLLNYAFSLALTICESSALFFVSS